MRERDSLSKETVRGRPDGVPILQRPAAGGTPCREVRGRPQIHPLDMACGEALRGDAVHEVRIG